jgi:hypothetical protein
MATSENGTSSSAETTSENKSSTFYDDEENLKKLCDFLRSREGPPVREALLMEKRVYYLKGEEKDFIPRRQ